MEDAVNHPKHYERMAVTIEPIDVCEALPFCLGNALKYIMRAGHKEGTDEITDLKKARWYLKRWFAKNTTNEKISDPHVLASVLLLLEKSSKEDSEFIFQLLQGLLDVENSQKIYPSQVTIWHGAIKEAIERLTDHIGDKGEQ